MCCVVDIKKLVNSFGDITGDKDPAEEAVFWSISSLEKLKSILNLSQAPCKSIEAIATSVVGGFDDEKGAESHLSKVP